MLLLVVSDIHYLFQDDLRAKGKSISRAVSCVLMMTILKLFSPMKEVLSDYGVFFLFSGVVAISTPMIYFKGPKRGENQTSNWFYLPETKDVNLENVRYLFTQRSDQSTCDIQKSTKL